MSERELHTLLRGLAPRLHDGVYVFATAHDPAVLLQTEVVASVREQEGLTVVVPEGFAARLGLQVAFRARWITLEVLSDLAAVGLTAAVAAALGAHGIACNVVAGVHHDHLFVPAGDGERARQELVLLAAKTRPD